MQLMPTLDSRPYVTLWQCTDDFGATTRVVASQHDTEDFSMFEQIVISMDTWYCLFDLDQHLAGLYEECAQ